MELNRDNRRLIAGLVGAGMDPREATEAVGEEQGRKMGSEQADILRQKALRAMYNFEG